MLQEEVTLLREKLKTQRIFTFLLLSDIQIPLHSLIDAFIELRNLLHNA